MKLYSKMLSIFRYLKKLLPSKYYTAIYQPSLPEKLDKKKVYLIGKQESPWLAVMACPCNCNATLHMNLRKSQRPCWTVNIDKNGAVSFSPSLWKKDGCKCHFFLKNGLIKWVRE